MAQPKIHLFLAKNNILTIKTAKWVENIDVKALDSEQRFEVVREIVLSHGMVFDGKLQKMAKRVVG